MSKKTRKLTNKAGKLMKCDGQMLKKVIEAKGYKCHELSKMLRYCSDYLTTCCRTNKISDVAAKYLMDYKIFPQMYDLEGEIKVDEPKEVKIDKDEKKIEFGTPYGIVRSEKDLRKYIRQALTKGPHWGTDLMTMRDILNKARANGLSFDVEDMRNDMFAYASNLVDGDSEKWIHFVNHMSLRYEPEDVKKYARAGKEVGEKINERMDWLNRNAIYGISNSRSPFAPTAQEIKEILNAKFGTLQSIKDPDETAYEDLEIKMLAIGIRHFIKGFIREAKNDPEFKELIKQAVKEAYEEL